ncbi:hypothetical protein [Martelella soudanensis]|uniref:hypothetical protein n=1 Tax=unclassified Martelella TaxID=2629616 RepID=UPI0015DD5E7D|nr:MULTISPECIES: hypothetical protein [unclassified Martelella]
MKLAGLVLVVVGLAGLTIRIILYNYRDVAGTIEGSLLTPLAHLAIAAGAALLALHFVYRVLRHVLHH